MTSFVRFIAAMVGALLPRQYRSLTPGRIIRGLHHYHPNEALTEKQRMALAKEAAQEAKHPQP